MAMGCIVKGVTPLFIGNLFAFTSQKGPFFLFDFHFVFILLAISMILEVFIARNLRLAIESPKSAEIVPLLSETIPEIELKRNEILASK